MFLKKTRKKRGWPRQSSDRCAVQRCCVISVFLYGFETQVVLFLRFLVDFHRESYHPAGTLAR